MSYKDYLKDQLKSAHREAFQLKEYLTKVENRFSETKGELIEVVLKMLKSKNKTLSNEALKDIYIKLDIILDKFIYDIRNNK